MSIKTYQQKCLDCLDSSLKGLGVVAAHERIQDIAGLIVEAMTGRGRLFHTPDHIFQVGLGGDDIELISALFHDTVYVQVDQGISKEIYAYLSPFIFELDDKIFITNHSEALKDSSFSLCLMTFGFDLGQYLSPAAGQNEFLSALFAAKVMEDILPLPIMSQVISCIEATIPFRQSDGEEASCSEQQYRNLKKINGAFGFDWSDSEIQKVVGRGVRLANSDIAGFASETPSHFLDDTWKLMPETSHNLLPVSICSIGAYRKALQKMELFLSALKAENIIRKYKNEPSNEKYTHFISLTKRNLNIACSYLNIKLLASAVLEAISLRHLKEDSSKVQNDELTPPNLLIADLEGPLFSVLDEELLYLLEQKRSLELGCDETTSQIAIYALKLIGPKQVHSLSLAARQFFSSELSAEDFLSRCPSDLINATRDLDNPFP
jgi:hypothetical protein